MKNTLLISVVIGMATLFFSCSGKPPKLAYIKSNELYNEFELKKELSEKLTQVQTKRKAILDSLVIPLKMLSSQLQQHQDQKQMTQFQLLQEDYLKKKEEFEEDNQRLIKQYSDEIWKKINQYIADYGKENGYGFIYGATGDGALMFAEDQYDITKKVSEYVNTKYKTEKK